MPKPRKNLTTQDAETKKLEEVARRKKKALEDLAEAERISEDLGMSEREEIETPQVLDTEPSTLEKILLELDGEGTFTVERVDGANVAKVGTFELSDYPQRLDNIARECGGGEFKISFRDSSGAYVKRITRNFDPRFYKKTDAEKPSTDDRFLTLIMESHRNQMAMFQESKRDMIELVKALRSENNGFLKSAQDIAVIGNMFKGKEMGSEQLVELVRLGVELAGNSQSSGGGSFFEGIVDKLISILGPALANRALAGKTAPAIEHAKKEPVPAPPAPPKPEVIQEKKEEPTVMSDVPYKDSMLVKMYAPLLLDAASKNENVETWANLILDRIPGQWHGIVLDIASRPDLIGFLTQYDERAAQFADWFKAVAEEIKLELSPVPDMPLPEDKSENDVPEPADVDRTV